MRITCRVLIAAVLWFATSLSFGVEVSAADEKSESPLRDETADVFGLTRVWKIELRVSAGDWKAMQPVGGGFPSFGPPPGGSPPGADRPGSSHEQKNNALPPQPPARGAAPRNAGPGGPGGPGPGFRPGSFGYEFDYVKADIELDGQTIKDVGLRFKGNGSYMLSSAGRKRPFKLDFNRFVDGQKFHGMQQLNLHNNVMDPTHVRQALSYPVFQAAGAASPRTAFAQVFLTIAGESEREFLGLYTLVEEIDKSFLRRHFQTDKGLLLKPEGTQGLEYKGEDWSAYAWYEAKSKPKKDEARRLIELTRLIHKSDDVQFRREIGSYLDLEQFAGFLAANTLLANMDSFLTQVHNYYLYLNPKTNRFVFLPWDLDLSMGAFFMAGSAEQLQDLSISHPHVGENKVIERLLAMDEFNRTYRDHLRRLTEKCFGEDGLTTKSLPIVEAALKDLIAEEAKQTAAAQAKRGPGGFGFGPGPGGPGMFGSQPSLKSFLAKRSASVTAQLAGTSKGFTPAGMGFGPGPGGGGPGRGPGGGGFGPGNMLGPQWLSTADANKNEKLSRQEFLDLGNKWLREWDKDKSGSLNGDEVAAGLNEALGPPPGAAPGGFKPPAGFGPGMFLGPPLFKAADTDKDSKVTKDEWSGLFNTWFKQWDKGADGDLDGTDLTAGLNIVFAPPPGFAPPGAPAGVRPAPASPAKGDSGTEGKPVK